MRIPFLGCWLVKVAESQSQLLGQGMGHGMPGGGENSWRTWAERKLKSLNQKIPKNTGHRMGSVANGKVNICLRGWTIADVLDVKLYLSYGSLCLPGSTASFLVIYWPEKLVPKRRAIGLAMGMGMGVGRNGSSSK